MASIRDQRYTVSLASRDSSLGIDLAKRLMHERPVALQVCGGLGGLADQQLVRGWAGAGPNPE